MNLVNVSTIILPVASSISSYDNSSYHAAYIRLCQILDIRACLHANGTVFWGPHVESHCHSKKVTIVIDSGMQQ